MKYSIALAMLAGAVIGATAVSGLHAQSQAKPPLYVIAQIDVQNADAFGKEYAPQQQNLIRTSGGHIVAIGGNGGANAGLLTAFDDGPAPQRVVLQTWDSLEQYQTYRNSATFKQIRAVGDKYAKFHTVAIQGMPQQ